jgi:uncharacterized RDD family membrane protein YckC
LNTSKPRLVTTLLVALLAAGGLMAHAGSPPAVALSQTPAAPDTSTTIDTPSAAASAPGVVEERDQDQDEWDHRERHERFGAHRHHGNDLVNFGRDTDLPRGQRADSVVSILGSSSSEGEARDVVSIFGDTHVSGPVSDSAVAVFGSTSIDSPIDGDAVAVFGNVTLGPHAVVHGDVVAVGGTVERDPAAVVHGTVQSVGGRAAGFGWLRPWIDHCLFYARPLAFAPGLGWAWGIALAFLALYLGLALIFREPLTRCVQTLETQPGMTALAAILTVLLTPALFVLLCITVIGIAAVPFFVAALFCAALFGKAVMLAWLGRRCLVGRSTGPFGHPAWAVLIGGAIVLVLYLVPVLGFVVYKLLGLVGLGAVVYTLVLAARAWQAARPASSPPPGASTEATMPGAAPAAGPAPIASVPPAVASVPPAVASVPPAVASVPPVVAAALPRAGFWIRMGALLLDGLLVGFVMHVLHMYHLELLGLAIYGAVMWKLRGSTIGGIVFDLRVIRLDGRPIDWETAIVRALSCFLSLAVAGLGFFWIAFDHDKQAWHDKIAGTVVVRVAKGVSLASA